MIISKVQTFAVNEACRRHAYRRYSQTASAYVNAEHCTELKDSTFVKQIKDVIDLFSQNSIEVITDWNYSQIVSWRLLMCTNSFFYITNRLIALYIAGLRALSSIHESLHVFWHKGFELSIIVYL